MATAGRWRGHVQHRHSGPARTAACMGTMAFQDCLVCGQSRSSQNYRSCDSLSWLQSRQGPVVRAGLPVTERRAGPGAVGLLLGPAASRTQAWPCPSDTGLSLLIRDSPAHRGLVGRRKSVCASFLPRPGHFLLHEASSLKRALPACRAHDRCRGQASTRLRPQQACSAPSPHTVPRSCGPEGSPGGVCVPAATSLHRRVHG